MKDTAYGSTTSQGNCDSCGQLTHFELKWKPYWCRGWLDDCHMVLEGTSVHPRHWAYKQSRFRCNSCYSATAIQRSRQTTLATA